MVETSEQLIGQILRLRATKVLVLGDVLLDTYIAGQASRISPEAPVPVVLQSSERQVLGGAANVAANIAALGASVDLCGRVGNDSGALWIEDLCKTQGIGTRWMVRSASIPTIRKTRVLVGHQQIVRIDQERCEPLCASERDVVYQGVERFLSESGLSVVVISDYAKGMIDLDLLTHVIRLCRAANVPVIADPKSLDLARYAGCTLIKPNIKDGRDALRVFRPGFRAETFAQESMAMAECFLEQSRALNVVLSLSEHGVLVIGESAPHGLRLESRALEVADVSGAGDTMVAYLAMGLAARLPLSQVVEFANAASGIACGKPGTATVTLVELLDALHASNHGGQEKIATRQQALAILEQHRKLGRRVIFTNGCFDILHAGHVRLLHEAKSRGDMLVVGLNSDSSVRQLKGASRPIQSEEDRAEILAGLAPVDLVVTFAEETPLELIKELKPDVLVKGGDYSEESIVGASEVRSYGGDVVVIPLLAGRSTTAIVERSENKHHSLLR